MKKNEITMIAVMGLIVVGLLIALFSIKSKQSAMEAEAHADERIYEMCMSVLPSGSSSIRDQHCRCIENKIVEQYPETHLVTSKYELWQMFIGPGQKDARKDLYLRAELPCLPTYTDLTCDRDRKKGKKRCACTIEKITTNLDGLIESLKDVSTHEELNETSYTPYMGSKIIISNWRMTKEATDIKNEYVWGHQRACDEEYPVKYF